MKELATLVWCGLRRGWIFLLAVAAFLFAATSSAFFDTSYRSLLGIDLTRFEIIDFPKEQSDREFLETLNDTAQRNRINLYRSSLTTPGRSQLMFTFIGDPAAHPADPSGRQLMHFNPDERRDLKPYTEFDEYTLLGVYYSNAAPAAAAQVANDLESAGYEVKYSLNNELITEHLDAEFYNNIFVDGSGVLLVGFMVLLAASVYRAGSRYRDCAIRQVCGRSLQRVLISEVALTAAWYLGMVIVWILAGLPLLYWYNQLADFATFANFFTFLVLLGLSMVLLGQVLTFALLGVRNLFALLKGYRPVAVIAMAAILLQLLAFFSFSSTVLTGSQLVVRLNENLASAKKWEHARDYVNFMNISIDLPSKSRDELNKLMVSEDKAGRLLLAAREEPISNHILKPGEVPVSELEDLREIMRIYDERSKAHVAIVINSRYLREQVLIDENGKRVIDLPEEDAHIYALTTDTYPFTDEEIIRGLQLWAAPLREWLFSDEFMEDGKSQQEAKALAKHHSSVKVSIIKLAPGQELFDYDFQNPFRPKEFMLPSPEVAVFVPARARVLATYIGYVSESDTFFTDPTGLREYLVEHEMARDFRLSYPLAKRMLKLQEEWTAKLTFQLLVMALSLVLLFLSGALFARIYCELNARRIFVERVSGLGFWQMHWGYLSLSAAAFFILVNLYFSPYLMSFSWLSPERFYFFPVWLCGLYVLFLAGMLRLYQRRLTAKVLAES